MEPSANEVEGGAIVGGIPGRKPADSAPHAGTRRAAYAAIGLTQTSSAYSLDTSGAGTYFRSTTQPAMTSCPGSGSQPLKSMTTCGAVVSGKWMTHGDMTHSSVPLARPGSPNRGICAFTSSTA